MHATHLSRTNGDPLDVETFASPTQQRRYAAAMHRIAAERRRQDAVRLYVSAAPRTISGRNWQRWLDSISGDLPAGVQICHYRTEFGDDRPYDWNLVADRMDGLVVIGQPKRVGSRVHTLGPVARLELRSLIAKKPVLLWTHNLGLVPVIDCKSQVMPPPETPRLKLIAPKRWSKDAVTLKAAFAALTPYKNALEQEQRTGPTDLAHLFAAPPR
ncbi:hypothetical protein [Streptomyces monashensis]|uniref:Uncharacterized protein n=1 Tax=Streptomyces monashensis TaxID=1678012 RepID=A0A1S2QRM6_9ACTN|nr:hypothetical protein [Streptomyces monashensis]OIK08213.1 hypothetical protein BIV23_00245 [Streptomyces monashensis]